MSPRKRGSLVEREQWSPERVVERIQARRSSGLPVTTRAVLREEPKLYYAACNHFGGWREALLAAGISPAETPGRPRVTREAVVTELRRWAENAPAITASELQTASPRLYMRAYRLFGSWASICEAAGLPVPVRAKEGNDPYASLSPQELYELWQNVRPRPFALRAAIARRFGSVQGLRDELGIAIHWTPEKVVAELQAFAAAGGRLTVDGLRHAGRSGLAAAAMKLFPSFKAALLAAGLEEAAPEGNGVHRTANALSSSPGRRGPRAQWTRETVLAALRDFAGSGRPVTKAELRRAGYGALASAVHRLFGSFANAREAASLPEPEKPSSQWAALSAEELYSLWRSARPRPRGLRAAIRERFGSVADLRRQASQTSKWTAEKVAEALREFAEAGSAVTSTELAKAKNWGLLAAAYRYYGSLEAARRAAGLPSTGLLRRRAGQDAQSLARSERERARKAYATWAHRGHPRRLRRQIERRFGSVQRLVGFLGHERVWTRKAVVQALRELERKGLRVDAQTIRRADSGLLYAVYRLFGSLPAARKAAGLPEPMDRRLAGLPRNLAAVSDLDLYRLRAQHPHSRRVQAEIRRRYGSLRALQSALGFTGRLSAKQARPAPPSPPRR